MDYLITLRVRESDEMNSTKAVLYAVEESFCNYVEAEVLVCEQMQKQN